MPHKDPEARRAYFRAYHLRNRAKILARCSAWHAENRAYANARSKEYHETHREEQNAKGRERYATFGEEIRAKQNNQTESQRTAAVLRTKNWRKANPGRRLNHQTTRRAQKKSAGLHNLTHAQWVEIQEAQDHCCAYCGKRCKGHLTQDHITPLSKGGSHTLHNVIAACSQCNVRKSIKPPPIPVQPLLLTIAPERKKKKKAS